MGRTEKSLDWWREDGEEKEKEERDFPSSSQLPFFFPTSKRKEEHLVKRRILSFRFFSGGHVAMEIFSLTISGKDKSFFSFCYGHTRSLPPLSSPEMTQLKGGKGERWWGRQKRGEGVGTPEGERGSRFLHIVSGQEMYLAPGPQRPFDVAVKRELESFWEGKSDGKRTWRVSLWFSHFDLEPEKVKARNGKSSRG